MKFLLICQNSIPNPYFSLKDLPGHGRFDIICRNVLAATRKILKGSDYRDEIYCYLKNKNVDDPSGWIHVDRLNHPHDEISVAYFIKENWDKLFTYGSLRELLKGSSNRILLSENGISLTSFLRQSDKIKIDDPNSFIILGAKEDLTTDDINVIEPTKQLSLGEQSMLASQAITYFRIEWYLRLKKL